MKSETTVVREICDWLQQENYFFWRSNNIPVFGRAMPKFTPRGLPDIFLVWNGVLIGMECKREGSESEREPNGRKVRQGHLTSYQADFGMKMFMHGAEYECVRSLEQARTFLARAKGKHLDKVKKYADYVAVT